MIKVNLLRNLGGSGTTEESLSSEIKTKAIVKVVAVILFPALLFVYEKINIGELEANLLQVQEKIAVINKEKSTFGDAGPRIERYNKEKVRVDQELNVIRGLSRIRLREVKALDALQSLIPARTWARKITINGNFVKLTGYTTSDEGVGDLIRALENSVYFSKVAPRSTSEEQLPTGLAKRFELEFRVGKQE